MTLLGKIVGVYKIGFKNAATGAGLKMDVLIIENLFYEKKVDKSYDLKVKLKNGTVLPLLYAMMPEPTNLGQVLSLDLWL